MHAQDLLIKIQSTYASLRAFLARSWVRRAAWIAAFSLFSVGLAASFIARPSMFAEIQWDKFATVLFTLVPLMTGANILAVRETARLSGVEFSYLAAFRLSVISAAANNLPLPGGPVMRIAAFHDAGAALKAASLSNVAAGILWMVATFAIVGVLAFAIKVTVGFVLLVAGAGLGVLGWRLCASLPGDGASAVRLFLISLGSAMLYGVALYHAMAALGAPTSLPEAFVISVAGVIGAAMSLTPSGFGIRESISAGLASVVGAAPAAAFAASALVYLAMMGVLALCALLFAGINYETSPPA